MPEVYKGHLTVSIPRVAEILELRGRSDKGSMVGGYRGPWITAHRLGCPEVILGSTAITETGGVPMTSVRRWRQVFRQVALV